MSQISSVCTVNDLKKLEVINLCNGKRMGCICDVEMDLNLGAITAIIVPRKCTFFEFFQHEGKRYHRIPWCKIERIGDDTILVRHEGGD